MILDNTIPAVKPVFCQATSVSRFSIFLHGYCTHLNTCVLIFMKIVSVFLFSPHERSWRLGAKSIWVNWERSCPLIEPINLGFACGKSLTQSKGTWSPRWWPAPSLSQTRKCQFSGQSFPESFPGSILRNLLNEIQSRKRLAGDGWWSRKWKWINFTYMSITYGSFTWLSVRVKDFSYVPKLHCRLPLVHKLVSERVQFDRNPKGELISFNFSCLNFSGYLVVGIF